MEVIFRIYIAILLAFLSVNSFAQLKAYPDTTRIKDTMVRTTFTVPEVMPEYPGGAQKMFRYLFENFTNKITISKDDLSLFRSPIVKWTVDETGKVTDVKMIKSTNISSVDNLLIDVVSKMPLWKPAEQNHKKVKQDFTIPINICFK